MKLVTKTALVAAMAFSAHAMAMQPLSDQALSAQTGKDGIDLTIKSDGVKIAQVMIHDNDGLDSAKSIGTTALGGNKTAGAIVVNSVSVTPTNTANPLAVLEIDTDGGTGDNTAFLNVAATIGAADITTGAIQVAKSNPYTTGAASRGVAGTPNDILKSLSLSMGETKANIQLGAQPQGAMIVLNGTMTGGLTINDLSLHDTVGKGDVVLSGIHLASTDDTNLNLNATVKVVPEGLSVSMTGKNDAYIESVKLGSSTAGSIGSVEIKGLDLGNSTILVSGH